MHWTTRRTLPAIAAHGHTQLDNELTEALARDMTLAEATRQFQAALEAHRTNSDEDTQTELDQAENAMNTAWLEHTTA